MQLVDADLLRCGCVCYSESVIPLESRADYFDKYAYIIEIHSNDLAN